MFLVYLIILVKDQLENLYKDALDEIKKAKSKEVLEELKSDYLGKKGKLTGILRQLGSLSMEEKKSLGSQANRVKNELNEALDERLKEIHAVEDSGLSKDWKDLTVPGIKQKRGAIHPLTQLTYLIEDVFTSMGFEVADGPEIEDDHHNFTALNIPEDHPARDMQDTLWLADIPKLLRCHTSPVQIRYMESHKPPIRIICPGRVFRKDDMDATHSPNFQQFEGLVIDKDISLSDLKGVLTVALRKIVSPDLDIRFRSSYFPFVEPGLEVDVTWKGGWLELLGCGMVHPNVLKAVGYDPDEVQGFAFGCGIERVAMIKHQIDDIRLFYENDPRFLKQFG
jgi:phenylalanyl-tRNA synthetase alpha chain